VTNTLDRTSVFVTASGAAGDLNDKSKGVCIGGGGKMEGEKTLVG